jgi:FAD/FMN-containing dehydrogenase
LRRSNSRANRTSRSQTPHPSAARRPGERDPEKGKRELARFQALKRALDPQNLFQTAFSQRLSGDFRAHSS